MSRNHSTAIAGGALVSSIPYVARPPSDRANTDVNDVNSFVAVNEDCYGLLAPLLVSIVPGIAMYVATVMLVEPSWSMVLTSEGMAQVLTLIALIPATFCMYRGSVQLGSLGSGFTYLVVAIFLPMATDERLFYGICITMSFVAAYWVHDLGDQP